MHIYLLSCSDCHCITHLNEVGCYKTVSFKIMINDDGNLFLNFSIMNQIKNIQRSYIGS